MKNLPDNPLTQISHFNFIIKRQFVLLKNDSFIKENEAAAITKKNSGA